MTSKSATEARRAIELDPRVLFAIILVLGAAVYFFRIGGAALGASEAYSALAASRPSLGAIVATPVTSDPGKQVFYYIALHYFARVFGLGETSLRGFSALCALASIAMVFALGRSMSNQAVAAAAALLWAFNPIIVIFARRARMYPMFAAVALAHLLLLWQLRRRPGWGRTIACGVAGAAMIYTHLAGLFIIGGEAAMLARDLYHGRRNKVPWIALVISLVLFVPYFPIFLAQSRTLLYGHWLDWLGTGYHFSLAEKIAVGAIAAAIALGIVFGPSFEDDADEPMRWCLAWGVLPLLAFGAGTIIVRPILHPRYLTPCLAMAALVLAQLLQLKLSSRRRNLVVFALLVPMVMLLPLLMSSDEPWRAIALRVAARGSSSDPVFFESGFLSSGEFARVPNAGFPDGFYVVPFNYYFHGANQRIAVPGYNPQQARAVITDKLAATGGGWLVTWKNPTDARAEMPDASVRITLEIEYPVIALYRIESRPASSH